MTTTNTTDLLAEFDSRLWAYQRTSPSAECIVCSSLEDDGHTTDCPMAKLASAVHDLERRVIAAEDELERRRSNGTRFSLLGELAFDHVRVAVKAEPCTGGVLGRVHVLVPYDPENPTGDGLRDERLAANIVQVPLDSPETRDQVMRLCDRAGEELGRRLFGRLLAHRIVEFSARAQEQNRAT